MPLTATCPKCSTAHTLATTPIEGAAMTCEKCGSSFSLRSALKTMDEPLSTAAQQGLAVTITDPPPESSLIGQIIGGCRIERKIGQGGMGLVFAAHHLALDITVALKILPTNFAANKLAVDRFIREARTAARLKHPNIVGVLNVGEEEGKYFIVMDFVDGQSLQALLNERGSLPVPEALEIIRQMGQALALAHKNKIIHRDIKPDNILLDREGVAKLADLGLAKPTGEEAGMTQSGATLGTPYYIAPEQVKDAKNVDHRSDMYSLGCTLYQMVCGKVPYKGTSAYDIMYKHVNAPVPAPEEANPEIPPPVAALIKKMMAKAPAERYQTPAALLADVDGVLKGKSPGSAPAARKAEPRRVAVWAWGAAGLAVVVAGSLVAWGLLAGTGDKPDQPPAPRNSGEKPKVAKKPLVQEKPGQKPEKKPPLRPALAAYRVARAATKLGKFSPAAALYQKMAAAHPEDELADDALLACAKLQLHRLNQPRKSLKTLKRLLKAHPQGEHSYEVLYLVAVAVEKLKGPGKRALATYRQVAATIPNTKFGRKAKARAAELAKQLKPKVK